MTTELTKQEKIDAAVAVIQERVARTLATPGDHGFNEYIEAHAIVRTLEERGVLVRQEAHGYPAEDAARKRIEGQAKRLLDEEAAKPDARILRFSSRDHSHLPRLNGQRRGLHGQAVGYTTPEVYERAVAACEAAEAQQRANHAELTALLQRAAELGFPEPTEVKGTLVSYGLSAFRELVVDAGAIKQ